MGSSTSRGDSIDPVRCVVAQDQSTQYFVLDDGSVILCRNGNQFTHYSAQHTTARRIRKKYRLDQK
jgi:hypothetical protein